MTTSQISDGSQAVQDLFSDADYVAKQLYQVRGFDTYYRSAVGGEGEVV